MAQNAIESATDARETIEEARSEALDKLAARDQTSAELIKLRFFAGLSNVDAARMLGLSERTAKRTWSYARAWLLDELRKTR